jgi:hypothetical protein
LELTGTSGIEEGDGSPPVDFRLEQNFPNPFNASTRINFELPTAGHVTLEVFNSIGQHTTTLVDEHRSTGRHSILWTATDVPSGVYFLRLRTAEGTQMRRAVLLK